MMFEQEIIIARSTKEANELIDEYKRKEYHVKMISYSESFGNLGVAILFEKP